jgi:sugar-phosphatase
VGDRHVGEQRLGTARWRAAGIEVPAHVVTADDATVGKPDPQPFLAAARALGVEPGRCLVCEDSDSGGRSRMSAGAATIAVGDQVWHHTPAARIPDLSALVVTVVTARGSIIVTTR